MRIETDPDRVAELARQREDDNWAFRSYLKGADIPLSRLDRLVHELAVEVAAQVDCKACANCCKKMVPRLTRADIERLATHLGLTAAAFKLQFLREDEDGDGLVIKDLPCPFLKDNACTVYDQRPSQCRSFPHLHKRDFVFRLIQVVSNTSRCPIVFAVYEQLKRELWRGRGRR
jgi:Fe-S-cluster containining protein